MSKKTDYLIIGAGIIGINIARALKNKYENASIIILEKENEPALHSSSRNSGVLHTGFYYKKDSLRAKFTRCGNIAMTEYCRKNSLKINKCGKVVVTKNEDELLILDELFKRGKDNHSDIILVDKSELKDIEPNAVTFEKAIFSPYTYTVNPKEIIKHMIRKLTLLNDVELILEEGYKSRISDNTIVTTKNNFISSGRIINAAGLYADKIAKDFGFSKNYEILPFKGIYLKYSGSEQFIKRNIYPVPNIKNPFLGVHFTVTENHGIKIGPTAIPVLWREQYRKLDNFKLSELIKTTFYWGKLLTKNSFDCRQLAYEEIKKYYRPYLLNLASKMITNVPLNQFDLWSEPGIRAQLFNKDTLDLLQDFVIEGDNTSLHVLNMISPGFTCSIPFSNWLVDECV